MQVGYVFELAPGAGIVGIVTYGNGGAKLYCRCVNSTTSACAQLAKEFAGYFVRADSDTAAWGRTLLQSRPAVLLTNF